MLRTHFKHDIYKQPVFAEVGRNLLKLNIADIHKSTFFHPQMHSLILTSRCHHAVSTILSLKGSEDWRIATPVEGIIEKCVNQFKADGMNDLSEFVASEKDLLIGKGADLFYYWGLEFENKILDKATSLGLMDNSIDGIKVQACLDNAHPALFKHDIHPAVDSFITNIWPIFFYQIQEELSNHTQEAALGC